MQKLHLVGVTTDQKGLILSARRGARSGSFHLPVDQDLAEAVEELRAKQAEAEAELQEEASAARPARVESALSVKEIQARLRQGRSVADVAKAAGVDPEWVERFAAPVFAERAQVISRVRTSRLRRSRLGPSEHSIDESIRRNLADRGVALSPEELVESWSARQLADSRWAVRFRYRHRNRDHVLRFDLADGDGDDGVTAADRPSSQLAYITPTDPPPPRPPRRPVEPTVPLTPPRVPKRATVSTGFRADEEGKATSRAAKERERANEAMRKAAVQAAAEAERAAARRAREREVEAARREREARAEEARKERERLAAERKRAAAAKKKAAAAKQRAAERAKAKAAKQAADQARRAEAALRAAERQEAARRKAKEQAAKAAKKKAAAAKRAASAAKKPRKKVPAKKAAAKRVPARKQAPAKKAAAKKAAAKKAATKKASTRSTAPAKKAAAKTSATKRATIAKATPSPKTGATASRKRSAAPKAAPVTAPSVRVEAPAPEPVESRPIAPVTVAVPAPMTIDPELATGDVRILGPVEPPPRPAATFRTELVETAEAPAPGPADRRNPWDPVSASPNGRARERPAGERRTRPLRAN